MDHGEKSDLLWWVLVKDVERENTPYDVACWFSEQKKAEQTVGNEIGISL